MWRSAKLTNNTAVIICVVMVFCMCCDVVWALASKSLSDIGVVSFEEASQRAFDEALYVLQKNFTNKTIVMYAPSIKKMNGVTSYLKSLLPSLAQGSAGLNLYVIGVYEVGSTDVSNVLFENGSSINYAILGGEEKDANMPDIIVKKLQEIQKEKNIDLIVSQAPFHAISLALNNFGKERNIPVIQGFHGGAWAVLDEVPPILQGRGWFSPNAVQIMRGADAAFSVSQFCRNTFKKKFDFDGIKVIPPIVDMSFFSPDSVSLQEENTLRQKYGLQDKKVVFLASRPVDWKNNDIIMESLLALKTSGRIGTDVALVVGGFAADEFFTNTLLSAHNVRFRDQLYRLGQQLQEEGVMCVYPGVLSAEEMRTWYKIADIFVQPSRHNEYVMVGETFGIGCIEAQAMGTPVIVSASGGLPENVINGKTGFVVTEGFEGDIDFEGIFDEARRARMLRGFAYAVERLLNDETLRTSFSKAGMSYIKSRFVKNRLLVDTLQFYWDTMNKLSVVRNVLPVINGGVQSQSNLLRFHEKGFGDYVALPSGEVVSLGVPPDAVKFFRQKNVQIPTTIILPDLFVQDGVNRVALVMPLFANYLDGKKTTVVGTAEQIERIREIMRISFEGPTQEELISMVKEDILTPEQKDFLFAEMEYFKHRMPDGSLVDIDVLADFIVMDEDISLNVNGMRLQINSGRYSIFYGDEYIGVLSQNQFSMVEAHQEGLDEKLVVNPDFGVTFLGTSNAFDPYNPSTSYVVWLGDGQGGVQIDVGSAALNAAKQLGIFDRISDYLITHLHEDHIGGFTAVVYDAQQSKKAIRILATRDIYLQLSRMYFLLTGQRLEDMKYLDHVPLSAGDAISLGVNAELLVEYSCHELPAIGGKFSYKGKTLAFSGDTYSSEKGLAALFDLREKREGKRDVSREKTLRDFFWSADRIIHEVGGGEHHTCVSDLMALPSFVRRNIVAVHAPLIKGATFPLAVSGETIAFDLDDNNQPLFPKNTSILSKLRVENSIDGYRNAAEFVVGTNSFKRLKDILGFTGLGSNSDNRHPDLAVQGHDVRASKVAWEVARLFPRLNYEKSAFINLIHDYSSMPFRHLLCRSRFGPELNVSHAEFQQKTLDILSEEGLSFSDESFNRDMLNFHVLKISELSDEGKVAIATESVEGVFEDMFFALKYGIISFDDISDDVLVAINVARSEEGVVMESIRGDFDVAVVSYAVRCLKSRILTNRLFVDELVKESIDIKFGCRRKLINEKIFRMQDEGPDLLNVERFVEQYYYNLEDVRNSELGNKAIDFDRLKSVLSYISEEDLRVASKKQPLLEDMSVRERMCHVTQEGVAFLAQREVYDVKTRTWNPIDPSELEKENIDLMVIMGSSDNIVPIKAAELYHKLVKNNPNLKIVTSGKWGTHAGMSQMYGDPEAVRYQKILMENGVPEDVIFIEPRSTNSGENIQFSRHIIEEEKLLHRNVLLIQVPYLQRRGGETFVEQYPWEYDKEEKAFKKVSGVTLKDHGIEHLISWASYVPQVYGKSAAEVFAVAKNTLGDLNRLRDYPSLGFFKAVDMPQDVQEAHAYLAEEVRYGEKILEFDPEDIDVYVDVVDGATNRFEVQRIGATKMVKFEHLPDGTIREGGDVPQISFDEVVSAYEELGDYEHVISFLHGNIFYNDHFLAFKGGADPVLYHRFNEPLVYRTYSCFVVWQDGRMSVEALRFEEDENTVRVYCLREGVFELIANNRIAYAVYGHPLVRNDRVTPLENLVNVVDDIFHFVALPQEIRRNVPKVTNGVTVVEDVYMPAIGGQELYVGIPDADNIVTMRDRNGTIKKTETGESLRGALNRQFMEQAIRENAIVLDISAYDRDMVCAALANEERGYQEVVTLVEKPGDYRFFMRDGIEYLEIKIKRQRMSHYYLGVTQSGKIIHYIEAGDKSKGIGLLPEEARDNLIRIQAEKGDPIVDMLWMSNGRDVFRRVDGMNVIEAGRKPRDLATCAIVFGEKKKRALIHQDYEKMNSRTLIAA